jgi:uncharacterized protein
MHAPSKSEAAPAGVVARYPLVAYFASTFAISWTGALLVATPYLVRDEQPPKIAGILMFPAMLLGPALSGVLMIGVTSGMKGIRELWRRISNHRIDARWRLTLLLPPVSVLGVLFALKVLASPSYTPNFFVMGILFGIPAGCFEEIGWMGYAYPRIRQRTDSVGGSVLLGVLWTIWHLPVIDYLGAASPHGAYLIPFFVAFGAIMTAIRVLMCCAYRNTGSVLLAQLLHMSSTGSLVMFSAPGLMPRQEVVWYGLYSVVLWAVTTAIVRRFWHGAPAPVA